MKSLGDGVQLRDLLRIMEGMKKYGIASVDAYGVKLTLAPETRPLVEKSSQAPTAPINVQAAQKQMEAARVAAAQWREQQRRDRQATKLGGGIGTHTTSLTQDIYEQAMKTPPRNAQVESAEDVGNTGG